MDNRTASRQAEFPQIPAPSVWCVNCGAETEPSWTFCGACGDPTNATRQHAPSSSDTSILAEPVPVVTSTPPHLSSPTAHAGEHNHVSKRRSSGRSRIKLLLFSLVPLLLVGLAAAAGYIQQQTQAELDSTHNELTGTRHQLQETSSELTANRTELTQIQAKLSDTANELQATKTRLTNKLEQLSGLRGSLDSAQDRLDLQANQIETLKSCLNGVSNALGYLTYSDFAPALAALQAVEVSCTKAHELF